MMWKSLHQDLSNEGSNLLLGSQNLRQRQDFDFSNFLQGEKKDNFLKFYKDLLSRCEIIKVFRPKFIPIARGHSTTTWTKLLPNFDLPSPSSGQIWKFYILSPLCHVIPRSPLS